MAHTHSVHRQILKNAWQMTWRHKWLWFLGFFAAFWASNSLYQFFRWSFQAEQSWQNPLGSGQGQIIWERMWTWQSSDAMTPLAILILIILVAAVAAIIWLTTASQGGLISAVYDISKEKKINFRRAIIVGTENFWKILAVSVLGKAVIGLLILGFIALTIQFRDSLAWWSVLLFLLGFVLLAAASIVVSFLVTYALAYCMVDNFSLGRSIKESLRLFFRNWLLNLEMGVILYTVGLLLSLAMGVVAMILAVPLLLLFIIIMFLNLPSAVWIVGVPTIIIFFILLILAGSAFVTFEFSAWVLLFKRLTEGKAVAKLIRVFHGVK